VDRRVEGAGPSAGESGRPLNSRHGGAVEVAFVVEVRKHDVVGAAAGGILLGRPESTQAVAQQHVHGGGGVGCRHQVDVAVVVHVPRGHGLGNDEAVIGRAPEVAETVVKQH